MLLGVLRLQHLAPTRAAVRAADEAGSTCVFLPRSSRWLLLLLLAVLQEMLMTSLALAFEGIGGSAGLASKTKGEPRL